MFTNNKCNSPYFFRIKFASSKPPEWRCSDWQWSPKKILQHLSGGESIALKPKPKIQYLMIDIDNHENPTVSVEERARIVVDAFDGNPLIYTSSDSGGLRIVYFIERPCRTEQLDKFAQDVLKARGVTIAPGFIEIQANVNSDRLPFGAGSYIVDSVTLAPIYNLSKKGQIAHAYSVYQMERLKVPDEYYVERTPTKHGQEFYESIDRLLREGLYTGISTRESLWNLTYFIFRKFPFTTQMARTFLAHWLQEMHNGCSDSINNGDYVKNRNRIAEMTRNFDLTKMRNTKSYYRLEAAHLSLDDVARIVKTMKNYKTQRQQFGLLSFVKANGVRLPSMECASELLKSTPAKDMVGSMKKKTKNEVWICNIPSYIWRDYLGFSSADYSKQRTKLIERKIVGIVYTGSRVTMRCSCYAIKFQFSNSTDLVSSLDEGLFRLYSRKELRSIYGPYRAKTIQEHAVRNVETPVGVRPVSVGA